MKHSETWNIAAERENAVLFIHGICGTPEHFRTVIDLEGLVPEGWSVVNLCLPGHGGSVEDFGRSSMKRWRAYAEKAFLQLAEEKGKVFLVGHSMGTLFSLDLAVRYPDKAEGLFLLNVPLRPFVRPAAMVSCLRLCFDKLRWENPREIALQKACGVRPTGKLWRYIPWIPRFLELLVRASVTVRCLEDLKTPGIAFQSGKDELVARASGRILRERTDLAVVEMADSSHFYYTPEESEGIFRAFADLLGQK